MSLIAHASSDDHQDILWQMNMRSLEQMVSGSYPVREGEPDCSYYMRTGECRFGATCRFNHPPYRTLATANGRIKGMYPERRGQPACQFYLKTGTCKSGATCKFHHPIPRNKARIAERVALNVLGYPLRPNEIECAFYMRNGQCKFGSTCKFNHPQPANIIVSLLGSTLYPPIHSPTTGELSFARVPFVPKPRRQSPSSYAPHLMAQGVLSVPLNTNTGQVGPVSPGILQHIAENSQNDGMLCQGEGIDVGSELESNSLPIRNYAFQKDNLFPERLGQPECQFYMKTGECRFGALCKFHHPRERLIAVSDCLLNPMGLPLRPGKPLCIFFSQYGVCKFGPSCKFDHPMRVFAYNAAAASSPTDGSVYRHFMASVPGTI